MPKLKLESGDGRALHRQLSRLILRLARLAILGWAQIGRALLVGRIPQDHDASSDAAASVGYSLRLKGSP
jgi:hypothetical protein